MPISPDDIARPPARRRAAHRALLASVLVGALCALVTLGILTACSSSVVVPAPRVGTGSSTLPPAEPAVLALPVTISLGAVRAQLEAAYPVTDSLDRARCTAAGGAVCHQYVYRRDPLELSMQDDRVSLVSRLRYRGRVAVPGVGALGSCGYAPEAMRRAEFRVATSLYWRADWRLGSRQTALAADLVDRCRVTVLDVDATPLMRRVADAQLQALTRQVDSLVPAIVDLRPVADSLWRAFQQPLALDGASTAWLAMGVQGVSLAPVVGAGGVMRTAVVLSARPRVQLGAAPAARVQALPALTLAPQRSGLRIPVDVELPFAEVGRRATALLAGEAAGTGYTVREVTVWGAADTLVVRVDVAGKMDGAFYLTGRLAWDAPARALRIDDLRYTVQSADVMTRLKVTLGAPLIRRALGEATGRGRLPLGAQLDSVRQQLTAQLNRPLGPGMAVGGGIRDVRVMGLFTTPDAFVVRVVLDGSAQLFVQ